MAAPTTTNASVAPKAVPKASPPPPFPLLHAHVTSDHFATPYPSGPWSVNINAPYKSFRDDNYTTLSAFMRGGMVKTWAKVCCSCFPVKGMYFGVEASQDSKGFSVNPSVYYKLEKNGEDNIISFALKTGRLSHTWMHSQGTFLSDVNVNVYDYFSVDGCINSRLYKGLLGGLDFVYDPTRSGLKSYRLGLKYLMTHAISYDATGAVAVSTVHSFVPGRLQGAAHLKATRKGYEGTVGLTAFSPCGAKMSAKLQAHDGAVAAGVSRMLNGQWRINVGVHGNLYKRSYGGVGVSFNYDQ